MSGERGLTLFVFLAERVERPAIHRFAIKNIVAANSLLFKGRIQQGRWVGKYLYMVTIHMYDGEARALDKRSGLRV